MSTAVDHLAALLRDNYSAEGWEVAGSSASRNKVWVNLPPHTANISDALVELYEATGAVCDHDLTEDGATLTFWCAETTPDTEVNKPPKTSWSLVVSYGLVAAAASVAPALLQMLFAYIARGDENSTAYANNDGADSSWKFF